jgi:hypothetical protein
MISGAVKSKPSNSSTERQSGRRELFATHDHKRKKTLQLAFSYDDKATTIDTVGRSGQQTADIQH